MHNYDRFSCKWISQNELRKISPNFLDTWWNNRTIPVDIEMIIEKMEIEIIPVAHIYSQCGTDAYFCFHNNKGTIVIDCERYMNNKYENRTRFSLAHELGHYVLHREIYQTMSISSPQEWIELMKNIPKNEYKNFEWQANEFAGKILVPTEKLQIEIKKLVNDKIEIQNLTIEYVSWHMSSLLAKTFGVSEDVIEIRLSKEKLNFKEENQ